LIERGPPQTTDFAKTSAGNFGKTPKSHARIPKLVSLRRVALPLVGWGTHPAFFKGQCGPKSQARIEKTGPERAGWPIPIRLAGAYSGPCSPEIIPPLPENSRPPHVGRIFLLAESISRQISRPANPFFPAPEMDIAPEIRPWAPTRKFLCNTSAKCRPAC